MPEICADKYIEEDYGGKNGIQESLKDSGWAISSSGGLEGNTAWDRQSDRETPHKRVIRSRQP